MEKKNMIILSVFVLAVTIFALVFGDINQISGNVIKEFKGMSISSTPLGAKVYIDGQYVGLTPIKDYRFPKENIGYGLRLVKDGYFDYVATITPNIFTTTSFNALLKTKKAMGQLVITTNPLNAKIYLDNVYVGESLVILDTVLEGIHELRIEKQGYPVYVEKFNVIAGQQNRFTKRMTPNSKV
ncbi:MAG TPA: PEGA domain-containing protein [Candidatus Nanoarchaeia archaeon]|nr:PEGA domain-containing protein [Candidatus Nanoarchaeia archaeon]